tara:strand:+ start:249 stop:374 length:126 start_codon:yes stop_codon:yes gene_type:complete
MSSRRPHFEARSFVSRKASVAVAGAIIVVCFFVPLPSARAT